MMMKMLWVTIRKQQGRFDKPSPSLLVFDMHTHGKMHNSEQKFTRIAVSRDRWHDVARLLSRSSLPSPLLTQRLLKLYLISPLTTTPVFLLVAVAVISVLPNAIAMVSISP